jgi:hypothetical protein
MQMTACGETFGGSVYQAPDVFMFAIHQTLIPKDAFMLTPKLGTNWGRRVLQFSANGVVFVTKLAHEDWPPGIQRAVLNQTPDWISSTPRH